MALRGTLTHWKTRLLADELEIDPPFALGLLETLWHVTAQVTPTGCIGHLSNHGIAMRMFTSIDPDRLLNALVQSGHLDISNEHRLVIHDWSEHSDDAVDNRLARHGLYYADGKQPRMRRMRQEERERVCAKFGFLLANPPNSVRTEHHGVVQHTTEHHEPPQSTTEHHKAPRRGAANHGTPLSRSQRPEARGQKPDARIQNPDKATSTDLVRIPETVVGKETKARRRRNEKLVTVEQSLNGTAAAASFAFPQMQWVAKDKGYPTHRTDDETIVLLAGKIRETIPAATDEEMADCMGQTWRSNFESPMAWVKPVTAMLKAGQKKHGRYTCRTCRDTGRVEADWVDRDEFMSRPKELQTKPCPVCEARGIHAKSTS